jgi:hypothetical protein
MEGHRRCRLDVHLVTMHASSMVMNSWSLNMVTEDSEQERSPILAPFWSALSMPRTLEFEQQDPTF